MGPGMEVPTWPAITDHEAERVLARYPQAGAVEGLRWHSPRPFSAATLIDTSDGMVLLKRHDRRVRSVAGLAEEHAFIAHLAKAGMPVPEILCDADGASAVAVGDWSYELHRQAAGEDLYRDRPSWTPFQSLTHAHAAGAALARLHRASRGFEATQRAVQPLVASNHILGAADPLTAAETYIRARPALATFLERRPWRRQLSALFGAAWKPLGGQPALWTHNDWHPSNLLWAADGSVESVFDFGLADRTCAAYDLATAIERSAFAWLELGVAPDDGIGDPHAALALIEGYAALAPSAHQVVDAAIDLLPLVHIEFALSEVDYFAGVVGDGDGAVMAWEGYALGHAAWFQSEAGRDFLTRLRIGPGPA
jgi:Ser/Thr protein kinase RdoA (MazF antagonist)